jgi:hypothetical protein
MQRGGPFLVGGWAASLRLGLEFRVLGGRPAGKTQTGQQTFSTDAAGFPRNPQDYLFQTY